MTLTLVAVAFVALCGLVELLARRLRLAPELVRKLAHMSSAAAAASRQVRTIGP